MGGGSSPAGDEELAFTCKVDNMEGRLPLVPSLLGIKEGLPVLGCADIVLQGEDGCGGNGHKLDIGAGHFCPLGFALGFLEHVDVLRDAIHFSVIPHHLNVEVDEVNGVEAATVPIKVIEEVEHHHLGVERLGVWFALVRA